MPIKVIVSNNIIEVFEYEREPYYEKKECDPITNYLLTGDEKYLEKKQIPDWLRDLQRQDVKRSNGQRARKNFRRLVRQNFTQTNFITLTFRDGAAFRDGTPINIKNVADTNKAFDQFMKRLRRKYGDEFKYIVVVEFQDANNRGAVHYHMLADLSITWTNEDECKRLEREFAKEIWQNGFVDLKDVNHVDDLGAYLSKYMVKRMDDERLAGKKAYRGSQNLERPLILKGEDAKAIIQIYNLEKQKEVYVSSHENEYLGHYTYKQYNLKRNY